ncbi:MAG TPA: hypothetical protein VHO67_22885 [Polyangia bacterium]|nr:hypothetical protein [Polyangia bacterium]
MRRPDLRGHLSRLAQAAREQARGLRERPLWSRPEFRAALVPALGTLVTFIVPAYVFLLFNDGMRHRGGWGDEGYFLWGGWAIGKGQVLYRDFMEFKPPFTFLTFGLALAINGLDGFGYRTFFTYFPLLSILALQASLRTRRIDRVLAMGFSLALIQLWVNEFFHDTALSDTESIGLAYYYLGTAFLLARTSWPAAAQGVGTALLIAAALSKDPFLPTSVVTWAACFFASERRGTLRRDALAYLKHSSIGGAVILGGLCLYMIPTGAMKAYLHMISRYNVLYRDPVLSFCVAGGVFKPTTPLNDLMRQWTTLVNDYANLQTMGFLIPFLAGLVVFFRRRALPLVAGGLLALFMSMFAVVASNCPWRHYDNMVLAGLFFLVAVALDAAAPAVSALAAGTRWLLRVATLTALAIALWPRIQAERPVYGTRTMPSPMVEPFPGAFDLIQKNSGPNDRIATNGNPILYVQVNRLSAVRESNFLDPVLGYYVGSTDEEKLRPVYEELERNRPKIVVLDPSFGYARERHQRALWMPFLTNHHYRALTPEVYVRPD